MKTLAE